MLDYLIYGAILFVPVMIILTITGFWRAFPLILLLTGLSFIAFKWTDDNYGRPLAKIAAVVVPLAIVASASWRPAASKFRLWVADGVVRAGMCAKWIGVGGSVATLAMARLNVVMWLRWCWWMAATTKAILSPGARGLGVVRSRLDVREPGRPEAFRIPFEPAPRIRTRNR